MRSTSPAAAGLRVLTERRERRYLDDHLHDVPDPVYDLLVEVGARVRRPLTVLLERDGRFPPMRHLLWQLERARAALAEGRLARATAAKALTAQRGAQGPDRTRVSDET